VSCCSQKLPVVNVTVKRRDTRSRHVGIRKSNANEPSTTHRNTTRTTSEPELPARAGKSAEVTCLLAVRCLVYRGRDSSLGFRAELENLVCGGKGKGRSGSPVRPKVPARTPGANCFVVARKRGNSRAFETAVAILLLNPKNSHIFVLGYGWFFIDAVACYHLSPADTVKENAEPCLAGCRTEIKAVERACAKGSSRRSDVEFCRVWLLPRHY
jgi:hypothetical protein